MDGLGSIYIMDDKLDRVSQIETIFTFIGEKITPVTWQTWKKKIQNDPDILILAARETVAKSREALDTIMREFPKTPIILIDQSLDFSGESIAASLHFPFDYLQLMQALHQCQILQKRFAAQHTDKKIPSFNGFVGISDSICQIRTLIEQVSDTDATVLILGESGTGKEVVARNIHALSSRAKKPFIPINCGAIPGELLESELFGHEKGAFTGAITSRQGRFELANGGTLFLDEIGDMPLSMQVKLLRVLQERCFERVGSNKSMDVDVRVIAATHRNLETAIQEVKFREDLYYRLSVFPIEMPPLRERREDISLLLHELLLRLKESGKPGVHLLPEALELLKSYDWPGNVRELANLVERMTILFPDRIVGKEDLPWRIRGETAMPGNERETLLTMLEHHSVRAEQIDLKEHLIKTELALINHALEEADWVVARAANQLSMRRTTLVEKIKKYGIVRPERV